MTIIQSPQTHLRVPPTMGVMGCVGNTPLLPLSRLGRSLGLPPTVEVYAKAEWFNPGGSVKDRPALNIIRTAMAAGALPTGKRLLDSTSGNMGISYATLCASLEIPVTLAIPANASRERIAVLRALGAELVLTDPLEGSDGAIPVARALAQEHPGLYWYADQYNNPANWLAHYHATGPEIWSQTGGAITHFVAGMGTSGTLMGSGRYLREAAPSIKIIAGQPDAAFHGLEGLKHMPSALKPGFYVPAFADRTLDIPTEASRAMVRRLAREEGLFVGLSSGAAAWAAFQVAAGLERGLVVTVFPDAGYKYLSDETLWGGVLC